MAKYLKFSLRTFLLVVFLICASLALYPRETIEKYRRQAEAVQLLESTGFKLERRIPENKYYSHLLKMFVPEGDLSQVVTANGRSSGIRDNDLHSLKDLPWLEKLYLANNNITDEGLVHLTDCHGLKRVSLWFTSITDDGLSVFSDKQELEVLDISEPTMSTGSTDVTRACLKHFEGLPRLKILKFSFPVEDDDLFLLATLSRFAPESLTVNSASNSGIFELTRWRSLKRLKLNGGSYLSLIPLQQLPNLRSLSITGSGIGDQHVAGATELSQIEGLSLYQSSASNWIVPKLMELPNLKRLDVRNTKVNCDVVPDLATVKSKCKLSTSFPFDAFALRRAEGRIFSYRWNHQCYLSADDLPAVEEFQCNGLEMVDLAEVELDSLPNGIDFQANPKPFSNESVSKVLAKAKCQWIGLKSSNVNLDCLRELDQSNDSTVRHIRFKKEMRLPQAISQALASVTKLRVRYNNQVEIEMELDGPSKDPSSRADVLTVYVDPVEYGVSDFSFLQKFPNLRTLDVDCSSFDFESLQVLSRLPKLKSLHGTIAKDFVSAELKGELPFKTLEDLKLKVPQACSGLLPRICQITTLKNLEFDVDRSPRGFQLSAEQTMLFGNLVNLKSIRIDGVTDDSLKNISKAKNLRTLDLNDGHLTEKSLETIKSMPKLKNARLYGSGLTRPQRESTGFKF